MFVGVRKILYKMIDHLPEKPEKQKKNQKTELFPVCQVKFTRSEEHMFS